MLGGRRRRRRLRELRRRAGWVADVYRTPTVQQWADRITGGPPGPDPARPPPGPHPVCPQWTAESAGRYDPGPLRPQWTAGLPAGYGPMPDPIRPQWTGPDRLGPTGTIPLPRAVWPG
jgi:hypothetical protein